MEVKGPCSGSERSVCGGKEMIMKSSQERGKVIG